MKDSPEVLTRLSNRVDQLEQRVFQLEHPHEVVATCAVSAPCPPELAPQQTLETPSFAQTVTVFPVLGKAMLGMAGAYVLRAIAEIGSVPKLAIVALAIAYAGMWLIYAARATTGHWFASAIYSGTSALILAPMLWELTVRFKVLSPNAAAVVLVVFLFVAYVLAWRRNLVAIVWVAHLTTAIAAIGLFTTSHELIPFIAVLLFMALLSENAAVRSRWGSVRPVAAVAADIAIWSLIFIYSGPDSSHRDYTNLTAPALLVPACLLLLIYGTSMVLRTALQHREITVFESVQAIIAFLLAADAVIRFAPPPGLTILAVLCLLTSVAGYLALFLLFSEPAARRNYQVYAVWSAALFLLGSFWSLNPAWLPSIVGAAAIIITTVAVRAARLTLAFQGLAYLVAAAFACGSLQHAAHVVAGAFPQRPSGLVWIISAAAILCYIIGGQFSGTNWKLQLFRVLSAIIAVGAFASILLSLMVWLTATVILPGPSHVAVIRTLGACSLALALALIGSRWNRIELIWISYGTLAFVTAKLLFEDLSQGHPEFIAASIFFYAVTLIMVPRVIRKSSRKPTAQPAVEATTAEPVAHPR